MAMCASGAGLKYAIERHRLTLAIIQFAVSNQTLAAERSQIDRLIHDLQAELGHVRAAYVSGDCIDVQQSRRLRLYVTGLMRRWSTLAESLDGDIAQVANLVRVLRKWGRRHSGFN